MSRCKSRLPFTESDWCALAVTGLIAAALVGLVAGATLAAVLA